MKTITIDATAKKLGRIATEAATYLMGKHSTRFAKNVVEDVEVHIVNASKLDLPERKLTGTSYVRYSGYPGGIKKQNMAELIARHGFKAAVTIAVKGMLPGNKLRVKRMHRLKVTD